MDFKLMIVTTSTHRLQSKILITGSWLNRFGFVPETIVTIFCQNGGLLMKAQGFGLDCYRQIVGEVRKRRGQMIQVFNWTRKKTETHLILEGSWLERQGFMIGDPILVSFESGLIRIKHLPLDEIGLSASSTASYRLTMVQAKGRYSQVLLNGGWLGDYGFEIGQGASLSYEADLLNIRPGERSTVRSAYGAIPKQINVLSRRKVPCIQMAGYWLTEIGYHPGCNLIIQCREHQLQIKPLLDHVLHM